MLFIILTSSHFTTQNQSPAEMLSASNSVGLISIRIKTHQDSRALPLALDSFLDLYNVLVVAPPIPQVLDKYFHDYIEAGAKKNGVSYDELKEKLALWYDGFRFTFDGEKVYNPVSIGKFINEEYDFRNYWYATATPVMLVNQVRKQNITVETIENAVMTDISYNSFDIMQLSTENVDSQIRLN